MGTNVDTLCRRELGTEVEPADGEASPLPRVHAKDGACRGVAADPGSTTMRPRLCCSLDLQVKFYGVPGHVPEAEGAGRQLLRARSPTKLLRGAKASGGMGRVAWKLRQTTGPAACTKPSSPQSSQSEAWGPIATRVH